MDTERDRRIRDRAYALWVEDGRPEGRSDEHWLRAEREAGESEAPEDPSRSRPVGSSAKPRKPSGEVGNSRQEKDAGPKPARAKPAKPAVGTTTAAAAAAKPKARRSPGETAAPASSHQR